jgi:propionyl-CoA synthetase
VAGRRALRLGYLSAFDGYYLTGDGGYIDEDGYIYVMGRTDDVLNVAGHRLSTGSLEAALAGHPAVAECAVIGVADQLKGQVPRALVVLKAGVDVSGEGAVEALQAELVRASSRRGGRCCGVASGGRRGGVAQDPLGQDAAQDHAPDRRWRPPAVPSTIEDASVLEALRSVLRGAELTRRSMLRGLCPGDADVTAAMV